MVYTSRPDYLDPPNWNELQQHQNQHQLIHQGNQTEGSGTGASDPHQLLQPVPPPPPHRDGAAAGMVRPGSMADRARLAKIPLPEHNLKCPRCDSTNTKFCYFNNYSLSQPRHFCKTCRRYWTRGGALRNVPVGGGCRRNKRSKSTSSKSDGKSAPGSTPAAAPAPQLGSGVGGAVTSSLELPPSQLPLLASFHPLAAEDYGVWSSGLNYGGTQQMADPADYPSGNSSVIGLEYWRPLPQFPCFTGLETAPPAPSPAPSSGFYAFNAEAGDTGATAASRIGTGQIQAKPTCSALITQLASVKMEEGNAQGLNLPRQYLGFPAVGNNNDHYWSSGSGVSVGGLVTGVMLAGSATSGAPAWTDLSGISSTSTGSLL